MVYSYTVRATSTGTDKVRVGDRLLPRRYELEQVDDTSDEPSVTINFEVIDGVPQCRQVRITAREDGREVRGADCRVPALDDAAEYAAAALALSSVSTVAGVTRAVARADAITGTVRQVRAARRDARRRVTDDLLRQVAVVYRGRVTDRPTTAVAEHFHVAHRTATLYVQRARAAGHLGAAVPGRAGEST